MSFRRHNLRKLYLGAILLCLARTGIGATVNLQWEPANSADLGGYRIYYGTSSGIYGNSVDAGNQTRLSISGLPAKTTLYFAAKAYSVDGLKESVFSNEVSATTPAEPTASPAPAPKPNPKPAPAPAPKPVPAPAPAPKPVQNPAPVPQVPPTPDQPKAAPATPAQPQKPPQPQSPAQPQAANPSTATEAPPPPKPDTPKNPPRINGVTASGPVFADFRTSAGTAFSVSFKDASKGAPAAWSWDFGDGTTSREQNPVHTYAAAGSYWVKLKVGDRADNMTLATARKLDVSASGRIANRGKGLLAGYGFEERGGIGILDASANRNDGLMLLARRTRRDARIGQALVISQGHSQVQIPDSRSLRPTDAMTLEAWVLPKTQGAGARTIVNKGPARNADYLLAAQNAQRMPAAKLALPSQQTLAGGTTLPKRAWSHLAVTFDGQFQVLYVNGQEVARAARSGKIRPSTEGLIIGADADSRRIFRGLIDEVRLYGRALSREEIANDMNVPVTR